MSDLFGNQIVGFPMRRLICHRDEIMLSSLNFHYNTIYFENYYYFFFWRVGGGGG